MNSSLVHAHHGLGNPLHSSCHGILTLQWSDLEWNCLNLSLHHDELLSVATCPHQIFCHHFNCILQQTKKLFFQNVKDQSCCKINFIAYTYLINKLDNTKYFPQKFLNLTVSMYFHRLNQYLIFFDYSYFSFTQLNKIREIKNNQLMMKEITQLQIISPSDPSLHIFLYPQWSSFPAAPSLLFLGPNHAWLCLMLADSSWASPQESSYGQTTNPSLMCCKV